MLIIWYVVIFAYDDYFWRSESKMALIQRDFRKDKSKPLRVRIVCGVKINTF